MASKAQASLAKIIAIISTVPKPDSSIATAETRKGEEEGRGRGLAIDIDLNLEVGPEEPEAEEVGPAVDYSVSPAESAAAVLCSSSDPTATSTEIRSECCNDSDDNVFVEKKKNEKLVPEEDGYIDLLLEAARELEGKPAKRSSPPPPASVTPKRGRNRAMPSRYRDSVLDPWGKPPPMNRLGRAARN